MNTLNPQLGKVQQTLLIPLYGRAVASQPPKIMIHDPKAVEIVGQLDYDFSPLRDKISLRGAVVRTLTYDHLSEAENRKLLALLAKHFPGCYYIFDTATDHFVQGQEKHDTLRFFSARIRWAVNDIKSLEQWGEHYRHLESANFFTDPPGNLRKHIPLSLRVAAKVLRPFQPAFLNQYQVNVFRLGTNSHP